MKIKNLEGLTTDQINRELDHGAKFVVFQYTISIIVMTFRQSSDVYFVRAGENGAFKGIGFSLITLLFGWWGIPWGPIYSIGSLFNNFRGGKNVTKEILTAINSTAVPSTVQVA